MEQQLASPETYRPEPVGLDSRDHRYMEEEDSNQDGDH